jgi:hypothetical protein
MFAILRNRASWFLGAFLSIYATAVGAEELLVMPFRCSIIAGRPVLTPSHDQGYRIFGQREQRTFTACSPVNPDTCKQWTVYRFDLECGGVRVPWTSVAVAADGPRSARAWVEDGRVRVRVGPWWNMAPGDPCARVLYEGRWQGGQLARYCAERRGFMPPAVVDMPVGFSPMLGTEGIFVAAGPPRSAAAPPVTAALPPAAASPHPMPPREVAKRQAVPAPEQSAKAPPPADQPAKVPPPEPAKVPPPADQPAKAPPPALAAAPTPPASAGTPEHPTIINRPDQPQQDGRSNKEPLPDPDGAAKFGASALKQAAVETPPGSDRQGSDAKQSIEVSIISMVGSPAAMLAGLAMVAAFTAGTFLWLRKHERANSAGAASREFASVSLKAAQNAVAVRPRVQPEAASGSAPVRQGPNAVYGLTSIPRNRTEALTILGMGVAADATQAAIKRIVDGLRLSWHPDYAKDDADRQLRELRLKQINAAWEILNGTRAEA